MVFGKIFYQNGKNFRFLFLLSCWLILFFSASAINSNLLNKVDAQTSGNYHYAPELVLTGSNYQDVTSTNSLQLSQFSVAAWIKTSTNFASDAIIVNKGGVGSESSGQNMNYGIWMTKSEKIVAGFESTTAADRFVTSVKTYNDNQWHYVIVTYGGSNVILYVDGVRVTTKSTSGASPETSGTKPVRIGANSRVTPPGNFFTGQVDEVRVWNDDLTTQQVADAFTGTSFNTAEQVLYLPFGSNPPPVANNQAITVNKNTEHAITLTATDPNNDPLTYTVLTQPAHGTLIGAVPNLNYNPDTDYAGADSFTFKANDGTTDSNIAIVSITMQGPANDPPVANNQAITVNKNTEQAITLTATDPNNDPLTYTVLTQPA
ncbi:MAG TPA: LamG-like jellyroll fold domain-containing protein, partial [Nitrososphaeraceae archaeon]|nr:LamG-like jellyroll fold domain-containing protein [Nitrososphaeraceae archaeon]